MPVTSEINSYLESLLESKRKDMELLHNQILEIYPKAKLWFFDGKDETGKIVSNPQIGYGHQLLSYADGKTKEFYQIGISANSTGVSVYFMGLVDKSFLANTYGKTIGKASVTGYCIKFKSLKDIHFAILEDAIKDCFSRTSQEDFI